MADGAFAPKKCSLNRMILVFVKGCNNFHKIKT